MDLSDLNMPKCAILKVHLKAILKRKKKKPKSKLRLPRITTGLDKSINQSLQSGSENKSGMNSNGPPRNYCGSIEQVSNRTCARRTKMRVYSSQGRASHGTHLGRGGLDRARHGEGIRGSKGADPRPSRGGARLTSSVGVT